ncbi:MAG: ABC-F family ATP-binding cassette domain-containing protein [Bacteroidota bacterium]
MLSLHSLSLAFGGQQVLDGVTWTIKPGQRIGLIGPNGAGKSTLLRVIAERQPVDAGQVQAEGGVTVGYLEQDVQEDPSDRSVVEETMRAFADTLALLDEEQTLVQELEAIDDHASDAYLSVLNRLERVHSQMAAAEIDRIRPRSEAILTGLGFDPDDLDRPLHTFSGGWRMRVALAKLLLQEPSVLLLDEPTNHLDIDSIDWLEEYLRRYQGTVVIVSHDRYFLDRMVTTTAELMRGHLTEYAGNYSHYLEARKERRALQRAAYDNQQREIAEMERFVERFRAKATKAKQAQSRIKMLEKMERLPPPPEEQAAISFRFPEPERSGRSVLALSPFSKTYVTPEGAIDVFDGAGPLTLERGDKVALIGKNGAGKSTLARILRGSEPFDGGREVGYKVTFTYFAQHQADELNPALTILDCLREVARGHTETELRTLLGTFLFQGDDVFKPVSVLSGGERSRVALARTLLVPANFLILDEPTNHLDIQSVNVLIEAMKQYSGTFVVVSHDRHFLDQVVNKVWRVEEGGVREFLGNYAEYHWQIEHGTASRVADPATNRPAKHEAAAPSVRPSSGPKTKEQKRREAEERRRFKKAMDAALKNGTTLNLDGLAPDHLQMLHDKLEAQILEHEETKETLEATLADPDLYNQQDRFTKTMKQYDACKEALADLYTRWEQVAERVG